MDQVLPDWAQPFADPEAALDYWELVCEVASLRWGEEVMFDILAGAIAHDDGRTAHIHNVARVAVDQSQPARRRALYEFLSLAEDAARDSALLTQWSWAGPRLRLRLQQRWDAPWPLVSEPVDERTNWIAAVETEAGCAPVASAWLATWGVDADAVWKRAIEQSANPPELRRLRLDDSDGPVWLFRGDMYTTGIANDLRSHLDEPLGDLGALVIAPTAHALYVLPITSLPQARRQSLRLLVLATLRFEAEPNPVSTSVFWYRGRGRLEPCMGYHQDGRIRLDAAQPLADALAPWVYPDVA